MANKNIGFIISIILIILSIGSILVQGFNFGIDFTGGQVFEIRTEKAPDLAELRYSLSSLGEISVQEYGSERDILIKVGTNLTKVAKPEEDAVLITRVKTTLGTLLGNQVEYRRIEKVGPQVGSYLLKNSVLAVFFSIIFIMIYIWMRFGWQFGLGVIAALLHDLIVSFGFLSCARLDFDMTTVAALLTILGYSVNDSVVIYDRIRENLKKYAQLRFGDIINISINQTLSRTLLTVLTTLLAVLAMIVFGSKNLWGFNLTIFVGIMVGTYSSIFLAAPVLVHFANPKLKHKAK